MILPWRARSTLAKFEKGRGALRLLIRVELSLLARFAAVADETTAESAMPHGQGFAVARHTTPLLETPSRH